MKISIKQFLIKLLLKILLQFNTLQCCKLQDSIPLLSIMSMLKKFLKAIYPLSL